MERQRLEEKLAALKQAIMDILTQVTVIEIELKQLSIKPQESPPRKKKAPNGASHSTNLHVPMVKPKVKKRVKPRPVETDELVRKNAMIPQSSNIDWREEQRKWNAHRAKTLEEAEPLHRLASGTRTYIDENTQVPLEENEQEVLPDNDYTESYAYKSKGHTRETVLQWVDRLIEAVLTENINPFLTLKSLEDMFGKLKKKFNNLNVPNTLMLRQALQHFGDLKKLFLQLKEFLNQHTKPPALKT